MVQTISDPEIGAKQKGEIRDNGIRTHKARNLDESKKTSLNKNYQM